MTLQRSRTVGSASPGEQVPVGECSLSKRMPTVTEFLSLDQWEDGSSRVRGTFKVLIEGGVWKACLNDVDGNCYAFVSAKTFTALLEVLERGLAGQTHDWRPSKLFENGKVSARGQSRK